MPPKKRRRQSERYWQIGVVAWYLRTIAQRLRSPGRISTSADARLRPPTIPGHAVLGDTPPEPLTALGERYRLEELIGEGAFARTYRARDALLARTVALKLLRPYYAADPAFRERFQREALAAAQVDHPNVAHVYDYGGNDGGDLYLVLQYIPGQNLKELIEEQAPLPLGEAIRIARQILSGLAAIHAAGIVHRDIKPQNVLVGLDGVPRVTDFGIAFQSGHTRPLAAQTSAGITLGTPAYMAPEQATGEPVSNATDLYAVGVVLFEMLTGRLPFQAENALAMMVAHVEQPPPAPGELRPDVPRAIDEVVLRALAKQPGDRFASAREMERALVDAYVQARTGAAEPPAPPPHARREAPTAGARAAAAAPTLPLPQVAAPAARPAPDGVLPTRHPHQKRRSSAWLAPVLAAAVALAILVGALVRATGGGDGNGDGDGAGLDAGAAPTRTSLALNLPDETPEPSPTRRTITILDEPLVTSTPKPEAPAEEPTRAPRPTRTPAPPAEEPEPTEPQDTGPPTIAPAEGSDQDLEESEAQEITSEPLALYFGPGDWQGGLQRGDSGFLGRPWTALYGSASGYGQAWITFELGAAPSQAAELTIVGVDDEWGGDSPITITVNGVEVFSGASPFPAWDGADTSSGPWTAVSFDVPAGALQAGTNQIMVTNHNPSGNVDSPPYVLLNEVFLET